MSGFQTSKVAAAVGYDMTTAMGLMTAEHKADTESVSADSNIKHGGRQMGSGGFSSVEARRFISTYGD